MTRCAMSTLLFCVLTLVAIGCANCSTLVIYYEWIDWIRISLPGETAVCQAAFVGRNVKDCGYMRERKYKWCAGDVEHALEFVRVAGTGGTPFLFGGRRVGARLRFGIFIFHGRR
jgi:hypothetical protein